MGALGVAAPERRLRPGADDPHVRARGGPGAPVGRRRHRLGLRSRGRDRGVVGQGAAAAGRRRRARGGRMSPASPKGHVKLLAVAVAGRGVVDPDEPVFGAGDEALLRGRAAFETTRVYGGRPFCLAEHIERLAASAASLGLTPPDPRRDRAARRDGARGRRAARRRPPPLLDRHDARRDRRRDPARARGAPRAAACGSSRSGSASSPGRPAGCCPGVKSTSYAVNMAGEAEARSRGADDAVFLANGDVVLEAPISNIWWRRGDTLHTPSLEVGVLAGVTRATLLELAPEAGYRVEEGVSRSTTSPAPRRPSPRRRSARSCRSSSSTAAPIGDGHARRRRDGAPDARSGRGPPVRLADPPQTGGSLIRWPRTRSVSVAWLS